MVLQPPRALACSLFPGTRGCFYRVLQETIRASTSPGPTHSGRQASLPLCAALGLDWARSRVSVSEDVRPSPLGAELGRPRSLCPHFSAVEPRGRGPVSVSFSILPTAEHSSDPYRIDPLSSHKHTSSWKLKIKVILKDLADLPGGTLRASSRQGLPWWSSAYNFVLSMQGAWVQPLVRELDPTPPTRRVPLRGTPSVPAPLPLSPFSPPDRPRKLAPISLAQSRETGDIEPTLGFPAF